ncbi:hypothetical protein SAMN05216383_11552 [Prevotella sp. KH2C16]|nr:hypothetical protein SAMN05216383_11552 [Prevotella sp. KH2C16]
MKFKAHPLIILYDLVFWNSEQANKVENPLETDPVDLRKVAAQVTAHLIC